MTLTEARALRDEITKTGIACTVPTGYGPDGYFAQIYSTRNGRTGRTRFANRKEWSTFAAEVRADRERERTRHYIAQLDPLELLMLSLAIARGMEVTPLELAIDAEEWIAKHGEPTGEKIHQWVNTSHEYAIGRALSKARGF